MFASSTTTLVSHVASRRPVRSTAALFGRSGRLNSDPSSRHSFHELTNCSADCGQSLIRLNVRKNAFRVLASKRDEGTHPDNDSPYIFDFKEIRAFTRVHDVLRNDVLMNYVPRSDPSIDAVKMLFA